MIHRRMAAPIQSEKHYVQNPEFNVAANGLAGQDAVNAVQVLNKTGTTNVEEGSLVKAIWFEYWLTSLTSGKTFAVVAIMKTPSGAPNPTNSNMQNLSAFVNKKNVLWTFEGLIPANDQNPVPIVRQWIKIPKGKQRMGLGDKVSIFFAASGVGMTACGFTTYKEYK